MSAIHLGESGASLGYVLETRVSGDGAACTKCSDEDGGDECDAAALGGHVETRNDAAATTVDYVCVVDDTDVEMACCMYDKV